MLITIVYSLLAIVAIAAIWLIIVYNGLVKSKNQVAEGWADIEVQLKRRYNLIPNLIETVKGYTKHEEKVFREVTEARTRAMSSDGMGHERAEAENALSATLKSLFAVAEQYPNLKANENFAKFQDELTDTENKIQAARRFYNGMVRDYNTKMEVFPTNVIVGLFSFKPAEFFETDEAAEREPVTVKF